MGPEDAARIVDRLQLANRIPKEAVIAVAKATAQRDQHALKLYKETLEKTELTT